MKKGNIYLGIFSALLFASCGKEIEVEKNLTTDWSVDQKIINSDIRTHLGYDPRFDWAILQNKVQEIPMITLSTLNIVEQHQRDVNVQFLKPLAKEATISLEYNPEAFEKVKAEYDGFELGEASLVELIDGEKSVAVGDQATKFRIGVTNQPGFTRKVIVPFSVKVKQGELKVVETHQDLLVKITPEIVKVEYTLMPKEFLGSIVYGVPTLERSSGGVAVKLSRAVPTVFTIGLERDDALLPTGYTLAQAGIEGNSLSPADFQNATERQLTFSLQSLDPSVQNGKYALPLKLVITDAAGQKHAVPNGEVIVPINIRPVENISVSEDTTIDYRWRSINKSTILGPSEAFNNIEGSMRDYVYQNKSDNFVVNFTNTHTVKSILIRALSSRYGINFRMKEFSIYSVKNGGENYEGKFSVEKKENDFYLIKFNKPLTNINGFILKNISVNQGDFYLISEIDIYE